MNPTLADPARDLAQELQAAQSLLALLQREQTQLVAAQIDGLVELSAEKSTLVARMTTLARSRYAALAAAAHSADESGMRAWLEQGGREAAQRLWTDLLALAESAKELNRTNGLLIGKHMARNHAALNVLQAATTNGNFYGPDGQSTLSSSGHRVIAG